MSDETSESRRRRFEHGMRVLNEIDGETGWRVIAALGGVSPELAHQIVAWGFGEMYARPELAPRDRQLVTLGMLTALGGCEPELEVHVNASLQVGLGPTQIVEALLHAAPYCGFPRAINATQVARKVFAARGLLPPEGEPREAVDPM
ncbi:4-carboxymuconolactone decarboxylase [Streptomyces albus subsp. albus]|nr:4-carboxymuconolactone decarboxylase [Streptomyces albus subsp. albus]